MDPNSKPRPPKHTQFLFLHPTDHSSIQVQGVPQFVHQQLQRMAVREEALGGDHKQTVLCAFCHGVGDLACLGLCRLRSQQSQVAAAASRPPFGN